MNQSTRPNQHLSALDLAAKTATLLSLKMGISDKFFEAAEEIGNYSFVGFGTSP